MTQSTKWLTQRRWWYVLSGTVGSAVLTVTALAAPTNQTAPTGKPVPAKPPVAVPAGKPGPTAKPAQTTVPATTPTSDKPAPAKGDSGWYLYQTSGVFGDQDVHISKNGIRIVDRKSGLTVLSKAPKWNVLAINPKAKTYCSTDTSKYVGMTPPEVLTRCGAGTAKIPFVKESRTQVAGVDAQALITPKTYEQQQEKALKNESASPYFIRNARFVVADKVTVPPQAAKILSLHYDVPTPAAGVPADMKYFDLKGNLHIVLVTSTIQSAPVDATIFDADTKGLKLLKTSRDVQKSGMTPMKKLPDQFVVKDILVRPNKGNKSSKQ